MKAKHYCTIRKDVRKHLLAVPIGNYFEGGSKPLEYRWASSVKFQIFYKGKWRNAQSIDFDFND